LPAGPLHFRLYVLEETVELRTIIVGLREQVRLEGTASVRLTVPLKPLTAETVMVEFASLLASTVELVGFAVMLKSTPVTVTVVEAEAEFVGEVPVTVMAALPVCCPALTMSVTF
jgi:hypothetical protein